MVGASVTDSRRVGVVVGDGFLGSLVVESVTDACQVGVVGSGDVAMGTLTGSISNTESRFLSSFLVESDTIVGLVFVTGSCEGSKGLGDMGFVGSSGFAVGVVGLAVGVVGFAVGVEGFAVGVVGFAAGVVASEGLMGIIGLAIGSVGLGGSTGFGSSVYARIICSWYSTTCSSERAPEGEELGRGE
jgi:hypothetical protein